MSLLARAVGSLLQTAPATEPAPADPLLDARRVVGRDAPRVDGSLKLRGEARFAAEVKLDGLCHAAMVLSTIAKGRVTRIDVDAARRSPGVLLVMTHENAPRMRPPTQQFADPMGASTSNLPVMQDDRVHWNGQPVVLVVAETQAQADHAASLVRATYAAEPAALGFDAAKPTAKPPKNIMGEETELSVGLDVEAALATAAFRVVQTYRTPRHYHAAIEPNALVAAWDAAGRRLTVHDANKSLMPVRRTLATVFGLKDEDVRILSPFVGGAFGSKNVWQHTVLCVAAAKVLGRPVRMECSREAIFRQTGGRTCTEQRVALGGKPDGTLAALTHTGTTATVTHAAFPEQFTFATRHLYAADAIHVAQKVVTLDIVANTAMRAPGESVGTFATESALDELAVAMKLDPIELRRRIEPKVDPTNQRPFSMRNLVEAYRRGAERFGWAGRDPTPGVRHDGPWQVGTGVATAFYPYYRRPSAAKIRLTADGRAVVSAAAHEIGVGVATTQTQAAAERLGLPADRVTFECGDTEMPPSAIAGGSMQTASILAAVRAAHAVLVAALLKLVVADSPLAGATVAEVVSRDGGLYRADGRGEAYEAILRRAGKDHVEVRADAAPPDEVKRFSMGSYGAQFAEVGVHGVTGEVRVRRWVGSFDGGRILNPRTAASQFRGAIIMGIGLALTEEAVLDERTGRIANPSLAEYHVPTHADVPEIDVIWTDVPDPHAPMGARGIGEIGITGVAAAIANAVYHATGKRVRELPITCDKVLIAPEGRP